MWMLKLGSLCMCQWIIANWPYAIRSLLEGQARLTGQMFWGQPSIFFPGKSPSSVWPQASSVCLILHPTQKAAQSIDRPPPLVSNHLAWLLPEAGYQTWWANGLFCRTVPVFLCNTALFVLSALCLSPVQPGRAGEGSQQHKDWIESCWSCKYPKVSKAPYLQYLGQNQKHYTFYDKRKWAFFCHSFPFHSRMH